MCMALRKLYNNAKTFNTFQWGLNNIKWKIISELQKPVFYNNDLTT